MKALEAVMLRKSSLDLLGTEFDIEKGAFIGTDDVAPDEPVDSFYEYLWGGWAMLGNAKTRDWYRALTDAILKYKSVRVDGRLWFQLVDYQTGAPKSDATVSELASFYAELLAKGGNRAEGEAYFDSWTAVADKYGLIPEEIDYRTFGTDDPKYWLRPEYANSAFDLWFLTRDEKYRRAAYAHFDAVRANCRVEHGYTVLLDVRTRPMIQGDYFPAYAFSENFQVSVSDLRRHAALRRPQLLPQHRRQDHARTRMNALASDSARIAKAIAKFDPANAREIRAVRAALRKRFPTAYELVYDNYNFFVIGYCATERPSSCVVSLVADANGVALIVLSRRRRSGPKTRARRQRQAEPIHPPAQRRR